MKTTTGNYFIIDENQDGTRMYVGELKGDPYFTKEKQHAKRFAKFDDAVRYRNSHRQIGSGRVVEIF